MNISPSPQTANFVGTLHLLTDTIKSVYERYYIYIYNGNSIFEGKLQYDDGMGLTKIYATRSGWGDGLI